MVAPVKVSTTSTAMVGGVCVGGVWMEEGRKKSERGLKQNNSSVPYGCTLWKENGDEERGTHNQSCCQDKLLPGDEERFLWQPMCREKRI